MTEIAAYSGWLGNNNIGDDALYLANTKLFSEFELVDRNYYDDSDVQLYGGGTVIPRQATDHSKEKLVTAIGVGVEDPTFRNQRFAPIDIEYHFVKNGFGGILNNKPTQYLLNNIAASSDSVVFQRKYIEESRFEPVHRFDYLGVRGPLSKEILARYGIESEIIGDTALVLEPSEYNQQSTNKIAVTLRSKKGVLKWSNDTSYVQTIQEFCQARSEQYEFVFIPFRPIDIPLHIELSNAVDNAEFRDYCSHVDVRAAIDEIAECEVVIGERLHASILAACCFTPFLSLGYQPKNDDFVKSIDMDEYHIRFHDVTHDWLADRFERIQTSDEATTKLQSEVEDKRAAIRAFAEEIAAEIHELENSREDRSHRRHAKTS